MHADVVLAVQRSNELLGAFSTFQRCERSYCGWIDLLAVCCGIYTRRKAHRLTPIRWSTKHRPLNMLRVLKVLPAQFRAHSMGLVHTCFFRRARSRRGSHRRKSATDGASTVCPRPVSSGFGVKARIGGTFRSLQKL